jgi:hypothetical protein
LTDSLPLFRPANGHEKKADDDGTRVGISRANAHRSRKKENTAPNHRPVTSSSPNRAQPLHDSTTSSSTSLPRSVSLLVRSELLTARCGAGARAGGRSRSDPAGDAVPSASPGIGGILGDGEGARESGLSRTATRRPGHLTLWRAIPAARASERRGAGGRAHVAIYYPPVPGRPSPTPRRQTRTAACVRRRTPGPRPPRGRAIDKMILLRANHASFGIAQRRHRGSVRSTTVLPVLQLYS